MRQEQNEEITRTGPDTPAGALMRRYWQPAGLAEELQGPRPAKAVRLLGEDLVLFKTEDGGYALVSRRCPHRGVDLCFGRLEDGGLRCPAHGWLFAPDGTCLEMPAEPDGSNFKDKVHLTAYPCRERNGIVFAYMGGGEPPALPAIDALNAPSSHVFAFKGLIDCNWLQALEIGIDPAHASFLHRFLEDEDPSDAYGKQFRDGVDGIDGTGGEDDAPMTKILREYPRPQIDVEDTDYGLRIVTTRNLDNQGMHVRVTNQMFPHAIVIPMSREMTITQWHVPVDDVSCYWYALFTSFADPVDHAHMREQRLELYRLPDYSPRVNKDNDYGFDPAEQESATYTGMGADINVHDQWAVESMGPIQDRTEEHLGQTDVAITAYRRKLRQAIQAVRGGTGQEPFHDGAANPLAIDVIAPVEGWRDSWRGAEEKRRAACPWAQAAE